MNTRHDHAEIHYAISSAAVGLFPDLRCDHGETAIGIDLQGTPCTPGALPDHIDTLMPRCGFTHIVGSVIAQIRHHEGDQAVDRFLDQVRLAESTGLHHLSQEGHQQ